MKGKVPDILIIMYGSFMPWLRLDSSIVMDCLTGQLKFEVHHGAELSILNYGSQGPADLWNSDQKAGTVFVQHVNKPCVLGTAPAAPRRRGACSPPTKVVAPGRHRV